MTSQNLATFEDLKAAANGNRRFKLLDPLPVSKLQLRIRSLTEKEMSDYEAMIVSSRTDQERQARFASANRMLIAMCLVDADGNRMMQNGEAKALAGLDAKDSRALYTECAAHVGISESDIEDLVKNCDTTTPSDSPTN